MYKLNLDTRLQNAMCKVHTDNITQEDGSQVRGEVTPRNILRRILWQYQVPFYGHQTTGEYRALLNKVYTLMVQINQEVTELDFELACKLLELIDMDPHTTSYIKKQLYDIFPDSFFDELEVKQLAEREKQQGTKGASVDANIDDTGAEEGETTV